MSCRASAADCSCPRCRLRGPEDSRVGSSCCGRSCPDSSPSRVKTESGAGVSACPVPSSPAPLFVPLAPRSPPSAPCSPPLAPRSPPSALPSAPLSPCASRSSVVGPVSSGPGPLSPRSPTSPGYSSPDVPWWPRSAGPASPARPASPAPAPTVPLPALPCARCESNARARTELEASLRGSSAALGKRDSDVRSTSHMVDVLLGLQSQQFSALCAVYHNRAVIDQPPPGFGLRPLPSPGGSVAGPPSAPASPPPYRPSGGTGASPAPSTPSKRRRPTPGSCGAAARRHF